MESSSTVPVVVAPEAVRRQQAGGAPFRQSATPNMGVPHPSHFSGRVRYNEYSALRFQNNTEVNDFRITKTSRDRWPVQACL
jgi:hypothetical protein